MMVACDEHQTLAGEVVQIFVRGVRGGGDLLVSFGDSQTENTYFSNTHQNASNTKPIICYQTFRFTVFSARR
jgi:hypothetical protein